jgi:hypothetical protein
MSVKFTVRLKAKTEFPVERGKERCLRGSALVSEYRGNGVSVKMP